MKHKYASHTWILPTRAVFVITLRFHFLLKVIFLHSSCMASSCVGQTGGDQRTIDLPVLEQHRAPLKGIIPSQCVL